jgi:hypothetical protein
MARKLIHNSLRAFTLIEVCIVLIVIGLISLSIILGSDLIEQAKIRKAIYEVDSYKAAINTFKLKYGELPGDVSPDNADSFNFEPRSGIRGSGDGNELIEYCNPQAFPITADYMGCELLLFWRDLSDAELINDKFSLGTDTTVNNAIAKDIENYFPVSKAFNNSFIVMVGKDEGIGFGNYLEDIANKNMLFFTGISGSGASGEIISSSPITPLQAESIDRKLDDGLPLTGNVKSISSTGGFLNIILPPNTCYFSDSMNQYALKGERKNEPLCKIFFNM